MNFRNSGISHTLKTETSLIWNELKKKIVKISFNNINLFIEMIREDTIANLEVYLG